MLSPEILAILKDELQTDPMQIGYASDIENGNFNAPAEKLNAFPGTVTMNSMSNVDFVTAFLPYLYTAIALGGTKGQFYSMLWQTILAMPTINLSNPSVGGMMAQAIADGVLTEDQATALNQRPGSRSEVLCGTGVKLSGDDIADALRS